MQNYSDDVLAAMQTLFPGFPKNNLARCGMGKNHAKRAKFLDLIKQHSIANLYSRSWDDAYYLLYRDLLTFPKCANLKCNNELGRRATAIYCCMACYKSDPAAGKLIGSIKQVLYNDTEWKAKTEAKKTQTLSLIHI